MPRDASGNVTLPVGNPVTAGTLITDEWANDTMEDIRSMLQDSFSRSGLGGANAPVQLADGSEANPSITFVNDTGSGFFLFDTGEVWMVVNGERVMRWIDGAVEIWDSTNMEWVAITGDSNSVSDLETRTITVPGELDVVFTQDINGAGIFINGPNVDNGALRLGTDYTYDSGTRTVTLAQSYPVGSTLTARRVLNFNPEDVVVFPVYNTLATAIAADVPVGTLLRTKGKVTFGDTLGAVYLVLPSQVVDEVDDHTMDNGNVLILQRFAASTVGFLSAFDGDTDVQTALAQAEATLFSVQATNTSQAAAIDDLNAEDAALDARVGALEAVTSDTFTVFESAEMVITGLGQKASVAHSIGSTPRFYSAYLVCKIAQHGYAIGDEVVLAPGVRNDGEEDGVQAFANATNIGFVTGNRYPITIYDSAGNQQQITNNNWRIKLRAIA